MVAVSQAVQITYNIVCLILLLVLFIRLTFYLGMLFEEFMEFMEEDRKPRRDKLAQAAKRVFLTKKTRENW